MRNMLVKHIAGTIFAVWIEAVANINVVVDLDPGQMIVVHQAIHGRRCPLSYLRVGKIQLASVGFSNRRSVVSETPILIFLEHVGFKTDVLDLHPQAELYSSSANVV